MVVRRATVASLLLHGAALISLVGGLHAHPPPAPPSVIEMAFLPPPEAMPEAEAFAYGTPDAGVAEPEALPPEAEPEPALADAPPVPAPPAEAATPEPEPEASVQVAERPVQPAAPAPPRPRVRRTVPSTSPRAVAAVAGTPGPATATPASPVAPAPAAPAAAHSGYAMALFAALERRKEYPEAARWRRAEGIALLRVALRRDGSVIAWRVERSSGHADLDASLERMIRRASPLPAPPPEILGEPVEFTVPVRFSLR